MTRKYLDSIDRKITRNIQAQHRRDRRWFADGCLVSFIWCVVVGCSLALWASIIVAIFAGVFFLLTGEFILGS